MSNKKYYWLKLKEDFFEEDAIAWIEEQENGKDYCLFYLKLCLKSLKTNGLLIRNVGSMLVPYDAKTLARVTNTELDTVKVAMDIFTKIGLVQILENGEIFISQLQNMVGSETSKAQLMRNKRAKDKKSIEGGNNVTPLLPSSYSSEENCYTEKEIEKEIELDIDKDIEKELDTDINNSSSSKSNLEDVIAYYRREIVNRHVLTKLEQDFFLEVGNKVSYDLVIRAMEISIESNVRELRYIKGIIKRWTDENIITLDQLEAYKLQQQSKQKGVKSDVRRREGITKTESTTDNRESEEARRAELLRQIRELDDEL